LAKCLVFPVGSGVRLRYALLRCVAKSGLGPRDRSWISKAAEERINKQGEGAMDLQSLIILLVVGAIAGWLAGLIIRGFGFGLIGNIIVGIVGAVIAGWLLPRFGIALGSGYISWIIDAVIGAVILLFIIGLIKR
jgi:uncharacterized membrane protein YeaQ/YmgE (transglycosylase-associated protein family)